MKRIIKVVAGIMLGFCSFAVNVHPFHLYDTSPSHTWEYACIYLMRINLIHKHTAYFFRLIALDTMKGDNIRADTTENQLSDVPIKLATRTKVHSHGWQPPHLPRGDCVADSWHRRWKSSRRWQWAVRKKCCAADWWSAQQLHELLLGMKLPCAQYSRLEGVITSCSLLLRGWLQSKSPPTLRWV